MMLFRKIFPCLILLTACDHAEESNDKNIPIPSRVEGSKEHDRGERHSNEKAQQSFTAAVILDGRALTQTFQRFFALEGQILNAKQQRHLGGLSYDAEDDALFHGRRYREINQSYVKTLRAVLLQLCQDKTNQEMQAMTATNRGDTFAQHAIVKRNGPPPAEDVNAIMTAMFGYEDNHYGAADYAAVVQENLATVPVASEDYRQKLQANYVLLCMAIGQDARVYLR